VPSSASFSGTSNGTFSAATETAVAPERRQVLLVNVPRAAAGYNSNRMVYVRQALTQEAYTRSVWVDTPARMLAPLLVNHLQQSGLFRAVLQAPSGAQADLRLDTTVVRLQQDFLQLPSRVHVEWQLSLMNTSKREVLAWHHIHVVRLAPSDDAAGGAQAGNAAMAVCKKSVAWRSASCVAALPPLAHKD
jgi:cholesterol transport system auxiliary component